MTEPTESFPSSDGDSQKDDPRVRDPRLRVIVDALREKKGLDIVIMGLEAVTDVADYFVLCTGSSDLHVRSLAQEVVDQLKESGHRPWHVEGMEQKRWILVDVVDVVVHVFRNDAREHYALERLWGDAELFTVEDEQVAAS
jgi:ribosome-associated protein